jgi:hypothetical protein
MARVVQNFDDFSAWHESITPLDIDKSGVTPLTRASPGNETCKEAEHRDQRRVAAERQE